MTKRAEFINFIDENIDWSVAPEGVADYWTAFKGGKEEKEKKTFTANGKIILKYMQEHQVDMPMGKAKDIGEGVLLSPRTVSGAMRKLVTDGFVSKESSDPVMYAITEKGKNIDLSKEEN